MDIDPIRRPYDLRHTYATFALGAGISIFDLSRFMGASLAMIDRHYSHLARDGRGHTVALLHAYARHPAAWTSRGRRAEPVISLGESGSSIGSSLRFGAMDVSWTPPLQNVFLVDNESSG